MDDIDWLESDDSSLGLDLELDRDQWGLLFVALTSPEKVMSYAGNCKCHQPYLLFQDLLAAIRQIIDTEDD